MPVRSPAKNAKVYARVTGGSRQFWCPDCGHFNNSKVPVWSILCRVQCTSCQAVFLWGSVLYRPYNAAGQATPDDVYAPQFADVQPDKVTKHEPINRLRTLNADGTWEEA